MSQHSFSIPNESGASFRADVNNALQALVTQSAGATEPATKYSYQLWADTTANVLRRRNAANSAWIVRDTISETFLVSRAANTILGLSDYGKTFVATANFTQTLTAAATLGDGWWCDYRIESGITITFDPNASENIDGAATKVVVGPGGGRIRCDGSGFKSISFEVSNAATATKLATARNINGVSFDGSADITLAGTIGGPPLVKRKTADENVISSNVLQDDDHLSFSIGASEEWLVECTLSAGAALQTTGIKLAFNGPSGCSALFIADFLNSAATPAPFSTHVTTADMSANTCSVALTTAQATGDAVIRVHLWVSNGANAGTVKLQWAQVTSTGTNTTLRKGSSMTHRRLA